MNYAGIISAVREISLESEFMTGTTLPEQFERQCEEDHLRDHTHNGVEHELMYDFTGVGLAAIATVIETLNGIICRLVAVRKLFVQLDIDGCRSY